MSEAAEEVAVADHWRGREYMLCGRSHHHPFVPCVRPGGHEGGCVIAVLGRLMNEDDLRALCERLVPASRAAYAMRKRGSIPRTVPRGVWSGG